MTLIKDMPHCKSSWGRTNEELVEQANKALDKTLKDNPTPKVKDMRECAHEFSDEEPLVQTAGTTYVYKCASCGIMVHVSSWGQSDMWKVGYRP